VNDLKKYLAVQSQIKTGDLIEWRSSTLLGWIIRRFTPMNHTSMVVCLSQYKDITEPRRYVIEAEPQGVAPNLLSCDLLRHNGTAYWLQLKPEYDSVREYIGECAQDYIGTPYDFKSLFKNALRRVSADADKLFCSEMAFMCYRKAKIVFGDTAPRPGGWDKYKIHYKPKQIL